MEKHTGRVSRFVPTFCPRLTNAGAVRKFGTVRRIRALLAPGGARGGAARGHLVGEYSNFRPAFGSVTWRHIFGGPGDRVLRAHETQNFPGGTRQKGAEGGEADVGRNWTTMLQGSPGLPALPSSAPPCRVLTPRVCTLVGGRV